MKTFTKPFKVTAIAAAISAATSVSVNAQTDPTPSKADQEVEVISVTATRRSQSIETVPYNISAVGGETLKQAGISNLADLTKRLPGLTYTDRGARSGAFSTSIAMRGLSTEDGRISSPVYTAPGVSTYVGETPLFANIRFYDIDRVEVLRGPQGTLYGSGSLGGTLRFIPNLPALMETEFEGQFDLSQTDNGDGLNHEANFVVNFPVTDELAIRANIGKTEAAGFIDQPMTFVSDSNGVPIAQNTADTVNSPGVYANIKGANAEQSTYGRVAALYEPNDDTKILLAFNTQQDESDGNPTRAVDYEDLSDFESATQMPEPYEGDTDLVSLDVEMDIGFATFTTSLSSYDSKQNFSTDTTGSYQAFAFYADSYGAMPRALIANHSTNNDSANIAELRLVSNGDGPLSWVVGGFYLDQDIEIASEDNFLGYSDWVDACADSATEEDLFDNLVCGLGSNTSSFSLGMEQAGVQPNADAAGLAVIKDRNFLSSSKAKFEDQAIFGELTYQVSPDWQVTGGFRAFKQTFDNSQTNAVFFFDQVTVSQQSATAEDVLLKFNTSWQVTDSAMLYATRSEGFRRGGANALPDFVQNFGEPIVYTNPELLDYAPDLVTNTEIGVKGSFNDSRYSLAAFNIDWDDIQLDTLVTPFLLNAVVNAGSAQSTGLEAEFNTRFDAGVELTLGYSFVDAKLTNPAADALNEAGIDPTTVKDRRLPGVSKHTASIDLSYVQEVKDWYVIYGLNGSYKSDAISQLDPTTSTDTKGFSTFNGYVTFENDNWTARVYVNNLFNEIGVVHTPHETPFGPRRNEIISRPRTFGVSLKYSFY